MEKIEVWYADSWYLWCWMFRDQGEVPTEQCGYPTKEAAFAAGRAALGQR